MRLTLKVIPRSSRNEIEGPLADGSYKIRVSAPPVDGEANRVVCQLLADHFDVARSAVRIISGQTSMKKVVEIQR